MNIYYRTLLNQRSNVVEDCEETLYKRCNGKNNNSMQLCYSEFSFYYRECLLSVSGCFGRSSALDARITKTIERIYLQYNYSIMTIIN